MYVYIYKLYLKRKSLNMCMNINSKEILRIIGYWYYMYI